VSGVQPDRRKRSSEITKELYERMYEADANVSPFHPSRSGSPAPYNTVLILLNVVLHTCHLVSVLD